jgi:hypothetical protein
MRRAGRALLQLAFVRPAGAAERMVRTYPTSLLPDARSSPCTGADRIALASRWATIRRTILARPATSTSASATSVTSMAFPTPASRPKRADNVLIRDFQAFGYGSTTITHGRG